LESNFEPIDPNPNILIGAGELRDATPTNPDPKQPTGRVIGTADAIHLMTCAYVADVLNVPDLVFHTYDAGKGTSWEGKCVPLLGFERWFPEGSRTPRVERVCSLPRKLPLHPEPDMFDRRAAE
jgi:hypothetical protein